MSHPKPFEQELLARAEHVISNALLKVPAQHKKTARLQFLEMAASLVGGFSYQKFRIDDDREPSYESCTEKFVSVFVGELSKVSMPPSLCLAALAHPEMGNIERHNQGVYYTDFRLAQFLAATIKKNSKKGRLVFIDPSCGTGMLLVALVLAQSNKSKARINDLLANSVCGADLSPAALRGARLSLASLTNDFSVIKDMQSRFRKIDSLISGLEGWNDVAPGGFDAVVGNPPWEKLRLTRHEWLKENGVHRHYGDDYSHASLLTQMHLRQNKLNLYLKALESKYELQGGGEHDLYKLFLELSFSIVRPGGQIALLIPGGFIRAHGTSGLRVFTFDNCSDVSLTIFDNKPRFFQIDSRFKFLLLSGQVTNGHPQKGISLAHASANGLSIQGSKKVTMPRKALASIRPDFSIPEVKTTREWNLFYELSKKGKKMRDPSGVWQPKLMREVDMTQDKELLFRQPQKFSVPLIEGRMVHQYRFSAKRYLKGTGRKATWLPNDQANTAQICSQYYVLPDQLPDAVQERVNINRAGFCDITGQTNERTMLASRIPASVVCGNKVPTVVFSGGTPKNQQRFVDCWLAIVNSFAFDWLVRRVATTSLNYFLLLDLPMPPLDPNSKDGVRLAQLSERSSTTGIQNSWEDGECRAEIEWRILNSYGFDADTLDTFLRDFPLLDRAQPVLSGESRSTVTRDLVLLRAGQRLGGISRPRLEELEERVINAKSLGAVPFIPSHLNAYAEN